MILSAVNTISFACKRLMKWELLNAQVIIWYGY